MDKFSWAVNTTKLRRIMDKMPNATEAEVKAKYIKEGGLISETTQLTIPPEEIIVDKAIEKTTVKKVKEVVKKAVKKVTKK